MLFVSHATTDDLLVDKFVADLRTAGVTEPLWVDHHDGIGTGDEWQRSIQDATNDCDAGIFVLTPASANSRFCEAEWTRVLQLKKRLYVVLLEPVPLADFPLRLGIIQYTDLNRDHAAGLRGLIRSITGKVPLSTTDPGVSVGKRITGDIDPLLKIPMHGRDTDLTTALSKIKEAPLFIVGIGGLGKSRLAYALVEKEDWNGAIWHRISDTTTAEDVLLLLRQHFDLEAIADERAVLNVIRASGRLLVVIDNAESVTESTRLGYIRLINALYDAGASVCVTSRELWRDVKVKQSLEPSQLSPAAASEIVPSFAKLLGIDADISTYAADLAAAARFHPRLIELAVGKLDYMPAPDIIAELRALKSKDTQDALTEMIRQTVAQMTAKHGNAPHFALRRLAVCRGGFTADAGKVIYADTSSSTIERGSGDDVESFFSLIRTLTDYRFARFQPNRYTIDDLVREAVGEDGAVRRAHFDFYHTFAKSLAKSPDHLRYVKMGAERDNLDAAFEWAILVDPEAAYWLANVCSDFLANRGRWAQRLDWFTRLDVVLAEHCDLALRVKAMSSLGSMYQEHPLGNRHDNLQRAVQAYEPALVYYMQNALLMDYAATQNNLGEVYREFAEIEAAIFNLGRAVTAYEAALVYWTPETAPLFYAATQNNLGNAYTSLAGEENRVSNLYRAKAAYEAALDYYVPDVAPLDYAMTQNNLGNIYWYLADLEDNPENLRRAAESYNKALVYYTQETAPLAYSQVQYNLGVIYSDLAEADDQVENLRQSQVAYEMALIYWTPSTAPLKYAMTKRNLGINFEISGDSAAAVRCWREAEYYYRQVDATERADLMIQWIANAENPPPDNP